jgi:hemolysin activation/secretion protein
MQAGSHMSSSMTRFTFKQSRISLLTSAVAALAFSAHAAGPNVDAGSLLRQTEQELNTQKKSRALPPRAAMPSPMLKTTEATVQVRSFKFVGNKLLTSDQLNKALASFTNRQLTLNQLREAADTVTTTYREAGWTVRAFLPKQEIDGGVVTLQIVEAVFGGAFLQGTAPERIEVTRLVNMAEAILTKGQPLHANDIDRTLLLLDDLPGVNVTGNLIEGQRDGESNLALSAVDDALLTGNASVDNQGSRSTGTDRLSLNLNLNSPAGMGDLLSLNSLKTQGSDYQRLAYNVPVGYTGWRAGLHASNLNYRVITDDFASLNPNGTAITRGWDISYPLLRSQLKNINLALSYDDKQFDNTSNNVTTSYGIKAYNATLSANQIDDWASGGSTTASAGLTAGDKSTESRYTKISLSLSRLQSLTTDLSLYVAANAQATNKNLDSSEKMYLGGANGVRAYPASEAGGSEGNTFTVELRQRLDHYITLTGFYDYGMVKANHDNNVTSPANPNSYNLQGYGVSLAWQATQGIDIKATLAQRLGNNSAAQANGTDADGTKKVTRIWLSTGIAF